MEEFKVKNELAKFKTTSAIEQYFKGVLAVSKSGEEFPVNLDDIWGLVYVRKDVAVKALKQTFVKGLDYITQTADNEVFHQNVENPYTLLAQNGKQTSDSLLHQNVEQRSGRGGHNEVTYYLTTSCMEYFVARKIRAVFDVYRQVFHKVAENVEQTAKPVTTTRRRSLSESAVRAKFCAIECVARVAHLSPSSVTMMCNSVLEHMELPLIDFTPAVDVKKSASDLLTQFGHPESAIAFNKKLVEQGYLKEESYTGSDGKPKKYKALTNKGKEYGENDAPKENPNKIQVHFYENKFEELYSWIYPQQELPFPPSE